MSAAQRPRCFPTHTSPRAGSSSFQPQHLSISGVKETYFPSSFRTAQSTSREPDTASQSDGRTRSLPGKSAAIPTRSTQAAAPRIDLIGGGVLVDLRLVDEDAPRLRAV